MSEMDMTPGGFTVPPEQDFDTMAFQGSMQQILQENLGTFVSIDFLIGTNNLVTRSGFLYDVGSQFVVLYNAVNRQMIVCDIFSVKFVTFPLPANEDAAGDPDSLAALEQSILNGSFRRLSTAGQQGSEQAQAQEAVPVNSAAAIPGIRTPAQAAYHYAARRANMQTR